VRGGSFDLVLFPRVSPTTEIRSAGDHLRTSFLSADSALDVNQRVRECTYRTLETVYTEGGIFIEGIRPRCFARRIFGKLVPFPRRSARREKQVDEHRESVLLSPSF